MNKLLEHFNLIQLLTGNYLMPEPYMDHLEGRYHTDQSHRDAAFINDIIYLADGPEQREAQAEAEAHLAKDQPK